MSLLTKFSGGKIAVKKIDRRRRYKKIPFKKMTLITTTKYVCLAVEKHEIMTRKPI